MTSQMLLFDGPTDVITKEKTKYCPGCGLEKPLIFFYRRKRNPDGYGYQCANCENPNRHSEGPVQRVHQPSGKTQRKTRLVSNYSLCQSRKKHAPRVIERDRICRICGSNHNLEVHLVDCKTRDRNKIEFMTIFCGECHRMLHKARAA